MLIADTDDSGTPTTFTGGASDDYIWLSTDIVPGDTISAGGGLTLFMECLHTTTA